MNTKNSMVENTMIEFSSAAYLAYEMSMMSERAQAVVALAFDALIIKNETNEQHLETALERAEELEERIYELEEENKEYEERCEAYEDKLSELNEELQCAVENAFDQSTVSELKDAICDAITEVVENMEPIRHR